MSTINIPQGYELKSVDVGQPGTVTVGGVELVDGAVPDGEVLGEGDHALLINGAPMAFDEGSAFPAVELRSASYAISDSTIAWSMYNLMLRIDDGTHDTEEIIELTRALGYDFDDARAQRIVAMGAKKGLWLVVGRTLDPINPDQGEVIARNGWRIEARRGRKSTDGEREVLSRHLARAGKRLRPRARKEAANGEPRRL